MTKPCPACDHERRQELDAALAEGAHYRELKEHFGVSIGTLRRHRAHLVCSDNVATRRSVRDKRIYFRFGEMPTGGVSHDWECDEDEAGLSVYRGLRRVDGGCSFDIPLHGGQRGLHSSGRLVSSIIIFVVNGRALYVASGTELAETGGNDEPLLVDATLRAVSPFSRVDLPEWLGEPGRRFADVWNRYRRSRGTKGPDPAARDQGQQLALCRTRLAGTICDTPNLVTGSFRELVLSEGE